MQKDMTVPMHYLSILKGLASKMPAAIATVAALDIMTLLPGIEIVVEDAPLVLVCFCAVVVDTILGVRGALKRHEFRARMFVRVFGKLIEYGLILGMAILAAWAFHDRGIVGDAISFGRNAIAAGILYAEMHSAIIENAGIEVRRVWQEVMRQVRKRYAEDREEGRLNVLDERQEKEQQAHRHDDV